jgi:hypothetical protein
MKVAYFILLVFAIAQLSGAKPSFRPGHPHHVPSFPARNAPYPTAALDVDQRYAEWWLSFENCIAVYNILGYDELVRCMDHLAEDLMDEDITISTGHNQIERRGKDAVKQYVLYLISTFIRQEYHTGPGGAYVCFKDAETAITIKNSDVVTENDFFSRPVPDGTFDKPRFNDSRNVTTFINERKVFYWKLREDGWRVRGVVTIKGWDYSVDEEGNYVPINFNLFTILGIKRNDDSYRKYGAAYCSLPEYDDIILGWTD